MSDTIQHPVVVIGAGPVGLAAAAHLAERGVPFLVLERGSRVGAALEAWGHVRVFSPWWLNIDAAARRLLAATAWRAPDAEGLPTGSELVRDYLRPLADHPGIAPNLVFGARVDAITRLGRDKLADAGREEAPFVVRWRGAGGAPRRLLARAVVDASGVWDTPNPLGVDGVPVAGEAENADRIAYGIPDVLGAARRTYAGRRVLVVGGGHSAVNVVLDLLRLQNIDGDTEVTWALRRAGIDRLLGGGRDDQLPARGALGLRAIRAIEAGRLALLAPFATDQIVRDGVALRVEGTRDGRRLTVAVDRIVVATGFRPDLDPLRELRVALDPAVEAPSALAPLIDPNLHSCGTVPPHGVVELGHPEPGFYIVGAKSYGRAPTFLMATGYEQVRSIVAELAGDPEAARTVQLALPETGVCSGAPASAAEGCCGGVAPVEADACCRADAAAKTTGEDGCGCGSRSAAVCCEPAA